MYPCNLSAKFFRFCRFEVILTYEAFSFLTDIYGALPDEVIKESVHLGLHRSDYMINVDDQQVEVPLQVEINTIASSFGCLSKKVGDFHRFMLQRNADSEAYRNLMIKTSGDTAPSSQVRTACFVVRDGCRAIVAKFTLFGPSHHASFCLVAVLSVEEILNVRVDFMYVDCITKQLFTVPSVAHYRLDNRYILNAEVNRFADASIGLPQHHLLKRNSSCSLSNSFSSRLKTKSCFSPFALLLHFIKPLSQDLAKVAKMIPENTSIKMLAFGLAMAHFVYGDNKACILFIVQPGEKNVRTHRTRSILHNARVTLDDFCCRCHVVLVFY